MASRARCFVPALTIEHRRAGDCLIVSVKGELDASNAGVLRTALAALGEDDLVIADLRDVPLIDSAALGALIGGIARLRDHGAEVALCVGPGAVKRVLAVSGFGQIVPTFDSVDAARRLVSEPSRGRPPRRGAPVASQALTRGGSAGSAQGAERQKHQPSRAEPGAALAATEVP